MASLREVGQRLKQAREAQGLSLEEVAARTRITVRHLLALEEGNETDLPETFYIRGFLKKYAEAVGLAPNDVADAYKAAPVPATPVGQDLRPSFGPIVYYMAIVGLLGGAAALAWHFQPRVSVVDDSSPSPSPSIALATPSPTPSPTASPTPSPTPSATLVPSMAPAVGTPPAASPIASAAAPESGASPAAASPMPTPSPTAKPSATPKPSAKPSKKPSPTPKPSAKPTAKPTPKPTPTPAPAATPTSAPTEAPSVEPTLTPTAAPVAPASPAPPTAAPTNKPSAKPSPKPSPAKKGKTQVTLSFAERSWVEVRVDGRLVFEGILGRGAQRKFSGKTVEVAAGNSGGVRITKDGKDLGRMGRHAEVGVRTYKP